MLTAKTEHVLIKILYFLFEKKLREFLLMRNLTTNNIYRSYHQDIMRTVVHALTWHTAKRTLI